MVSMATCNVILLKMGLDLQTQSYLSAYLSQKTKLGTKLKLRHWPFTPFSKIQTTIKALINCQALCLLEPLFSQGDEWLKCSQIYLNNQNIMFVSLLQYHV